MKIIHTIIVSACCAYVFMDTGAAGTANADVGSTPAHELARGNTLFAFNMYHQLSATPGNLFFSPVSIRTALAMTCAGARGQTSDQMKNALQFTLEGDALHRAFADTIKTLNTGGGNDYEMSVANSLWGDTTSTFLLPFIDINKKFYNGALERLDFRNASESARLKINAWVEEQTRTKIKNLLTPGSVSADTRLVLVNAVYFKGLWIEPFDKKLTNNEPFYCADGRTVDVPLMTFSEAQNLPFYSEEGLKMIELAYKGDDISMLIVLPDTASGLGAIEQKLDEPTLGRWVAGLRSRSVQIFLPRFRLTWGAKNIVPELQTLGMRDAFDGGAADFSGIDGTRDLLISGVYHEAFVDVYEEGTEAAAATAVAVAATAMPAPPEIFRADHPFLFVISEKATGAILFMGRMSAPQP